MHPQTMNRKKLKMRWANAGRAMKFSGGLIFLLCCVISVYAQKASPQASTNGNALEKRAALNLQAAKNNPLALRHFLLGMPRGADLHNHLVGAVYAETWIRVAAEANLCMDLQGHSFLQPQTDGACPSGQAPASEALQSQSVYDALVDAFSMRTFVPSTRH